MTEAEKVREEAGKACQQELALILYYQAKVGSIRAWDTWLKALITLFPMIMILFLDVQWPGVMVALALVQVLTCTLWVSFCSLQRIVDLHASLTDHIRLLNAFERICRKDSANLTREDLELVVGRASVTDRWEGLDAPGPNDSTFHRMLEEVRENYRVPGDV